MEARPNQRSNWGRDPILVRTCFARRNRLCDASTELRTVAARIYC